MWPEVCHYPTTRLVPCSSQSKSSLEMPYLGGCYKAIDCDMSHSLLHLQPFWQFSICWEKPEHLAQNCKSASTQHVVCFHYGGRCRKCTRTIKNSTFTTMAAHTHGQLNDHSIEILLKSGASYLGVYQDYVSPNELKPMDPVQLTNADGRGLTSLGLTTMKVCLPNLTTQQTIICCGGMLICTAIFGYDFLMGMAWSSISRKAYSAAERTCPWKADWSYLQSHPACWSWMGLPISCNICITQSLESNRDFRLHWFQMMLGNPFGFWNVKRRSLSKTERILNLGRLKWRIFFDRLHL